MPSFDKLSSALRELGFEDVVVVASLPGGRFGVVRHSCSMERAQALLEETAAILLDMIAADSPVELPTVKSRKPDFPKQV